MRLGGQNQADKRESASLLKELLSDAFMPGTVTVLRGAPGTGKSTLLIDFLVTTVANKNKCLAILNRQGQEAFENHATGMGYEKEDLEAVTICQWVDSIEESPDLADTRIKKELWDVVVIDSGTALIHKSQNRSKAELELERTLEDLRMTGATVVVSQEDLRRDLSQPLEFMADNVVELIVEGSSSGHFDRRLRVIKSCKASNVGEYILFLGADGRPHLINLESKHVVRSEKRGEKAKFAEVKPISTGIDGLDEILTNGFAEGSIVLITGPAGSRKTLCGLGFLAGEADGPKLLISTKKQKEELFKAQVHSLSERLQPLTEVVYGAGHARLGQLYSWVRTEIKEGKRYKRVVINTISDFAQMSAGSRHFEDVLFKMLQLLNGNGATVLLIADISGLRNQEVLNEENLLAFVDTHLQVRKDIVAYTEYLTFRIAKHWQINYDTEIKELVLEDEKLKVKSSFQMFTGLRDGEPQPLKVNLKLIAENDAERSFGELLRKECEFIVGAEQQVKADYYSTVEIGDIFEACMTNLPFLKISSTIAMVDEPWVRLVITRRKKELANLECEGEHVEQSKLRKVYFDSLVENCYCFGDDKNVYALPLYSDVGLFCINHSLVSTNTAVTKWEDVKNICKDVQCQNGTEYGFLFDVFLPDSAACFMLELIWGHDATCLWEGSFNIGACSKALEFLQNLVKEHITPSYSELCELCQPENNQDPSDTLYNRLCKLMPKVAFWRVWYPELINIFQLAKRGEKPKVSVTTLPTAGPKGRAHSMLGPWYIVGFSGPAPRALATVIKELSSPDKEYHRFIAGAGLPVRKDVGKRVAKHRVKCTNLSFEDLKAKLLDNGRSRSRLRSFPKLRNVLFDCVVAVMDNVDADPEELARKIESTFRNAQKNK